MKTRIRRGRTRLDKKHRCVIKGKTKVKCGKINQNQRKAGKNRKARRGKRWRETRQYIEKATSITASAKTLNNNPMCVCALKWNGT